MDNQELLAQLEALREENEALRAKAVRPLTMKVGEKGGLSVYGLGRFPVTLYAAQWERLLGAADSIQTFINDNRAVLKTKE